ncbi:tyrosine-type recombinase/integrase [Sphingomonas colocasiae]|uniref:Tyrosine-type recombinase/integrase n=1 Tax=Sphingomonas colocasiae TaxID=1848973 RepID=A0ABS7PQE9_9SPHN|nr:tyrosine-type recombinase/integrase [Sphingomonas colocasiae]MBY8823557.1 tyrosine-type recombinase/integrase [Sphingomonas colocasiae]
MAKTVADLPLQTRASRLRLKPRAKPYWRAITEGFHLGYYRGRRKAAWVARLRCPDKEDSYWTERLGQTDDILPADSDHVLSYPQALDKAIRWKAIKLEQASPQAELDPEITVEQVVKVYIGKRDARRSLQAGRTVRSDAHYKLKAHVLADRRIAGMTLARLTEADLIAWQGRLVRLAPSSRQRVVNEFKAALNEGYLTHRRALPADVPVAIRYGLQVETGGVVISRARENQILPDDEIRRIVAESLGLDEDFGRLVLLLAATGARFAQLRRMTVGDVQSGQSRLLIPQSFKGKRKTVEYIRVAVGADVISALAPVVNDRPASAPLLERWRMHQVSAMHWVRDSRGAWTTASEMTRLWAKVIDATGLPTATIPYALRHSSIVRGLRSGLPIRLVAALHDTSVAMIERHYSRWITEGLEEMVARAVVPMIGGARADNTPPVERVPDRILV